jgi:methylated-DNA-[protein]-cysteine S-methyltransferase
MNETDDLERRLIGAGARLTPEPPDLPTAAAAAGMLDVAYATTDSPLGPLLLASTEQGLVRVAYLEFADREAVLQSLADRVSPRMLEAPRRLDRPRRELDDYFGGRRREFDLPLDRRLMSDFMRRVLSATATIPYGSVSTYGAVAREAGSPRGSRAAGNALGSNPMPIVIPCHRVLHADGGIGGYTGGLDRKRTLLELESAQPRLLD